VVIRIGVSEPATRFTPRNIARKRDACASLLDGSLNRHPAARDLRDALTRGIAMVMQTNTSRAIILAVTGNVP
jgi:hypothetical protein